jgi:hypothetical protein
VGFKVTKLIKTAHHLIAVVLLRASLAYQMPCK